MVPNTDGEAHTWVDSSNGNEANMLPGATNVMTVRNGLLFPYNREPKLYVCPDHDQVVVGGPWPRGLPPARSYSISCQMGCGKYVDNNVFYPLFITDNPFTAPAHSKVVQISRPGPAMAFVFIDESMYSIDDGCFAVRVTSGKTNFFTGDTGDTWLNYPASRHGGSAALSFADGHCELKRWLEPSTAGLRGPGWQAALPWGKQRNRDLQWVSDRYINPPKPSVPANVAV